MSKHYESAKALCPFYKHESSQMVYCDSAIDGAVDHRAFANKSDALAHKKARCKKDYEKCPYYKLLSN